MPCYLLRFRELKRYHRDDRPARRRRVVAAFLEFMQLRHTLRADGFDGRLSDFVEPLLPHTNEEVPLNHTQAAIPIFVERSPCPISI
jgi:hypothetical protein